MIAASRDAEPGAPVLLGDERGEVPRLGQAPDELLRVFASEFEASPIGVAKTPAELADVMAQTGVKVRVTAGVIICIDRRVTHCGTLPPSPRLHPATQSLVQANMIRLPTAVPDGTALDPSEPLNVAIVNIDRAPSVVFSSGAPRFSRPARTLHIHACGRKQSCSTIISRFGPVPPGICRSRADRRGASTDPDSPC